MSNLGVQELVLIFVIVFVLALVVLVFPYWRIFKKAGFSPALSFLMIKPLVNICMLYYLALTEWPSLREKQVH
jgi:hypothetical protein